MPSPPPEVWQALVRQCLPLHGRGKLLIVSVVGGRVQPSEPASLQQIVDDFVRVALLAAEAGAKVIELNLSCPNTDDALLYVDLKATERVCEAVRKALPVDVKILVKVGYLQDHQTRDFVLATAENVDGYTAINTFAVETYQPLQYGEDRPVFGEGVRAGLSGPPIRRLALRCVKRLRDDLLRENLSRGVIGTGGVSSPEDVTALLDAGADVVQAATIFLSDARFAVRVREHLRELKGATLLTTQERVKLARQNWTEAIGVLEDQGLGEALEEVGYPAFLEWRKNNVPIQPGINYPLRVPSIGEFVELLRSRLKG